MTDDELFTELRRRLERDNGIRIALENVLYECGFVLHDLEPEGPRRLWILRAGQWLNPNYLKRRPAPLTFLGCDEFGNTTACLRLPGRRLLVLALNVPLCRELWEREEDEIQPHGSEPCITIDSCKTFRNHLRSTARHSDPREDHP